MLTFVLELNHSKYLRFYFFTCFEYVFLVSGEVVFLIYHGSSNDFTELKFLSLAMKAVSWQWYIILFVKSTSNTDDVYRWYLTAILN